MIEECTYSLVPHGMTTPRVRGKRGRIFIRDGWRCRYCGTPVTLKRRNTPKTATLDHVVPLTRGGWNAEANMVTACPTCNNRKGDRTPEEAGMTLLPIPLVEN